jgi:malate permease and related proteins
MNEQTQLVFGAVIPVFGIIGVGLLMRKLNWLIEEADQSLLRVSVNLLFPCLILDKSLGNPALSGWSNLALAPVVGFGTVALGMLLALISKRMNGLKTSKEARTFAANVGIHNYGYVPLPLAMVLYDNETVGERLAIYLIAARK